nr:hypothetical protein StreXyl84_60990 [Streptomyces sp. Xyl84]
MHRSAGRPGRPRARPRFRPGRFAGAENQRNPAPFGFLGPASRGTHDAPPARRSILAGNGSTGRLHGRAVGAAGEIAKETSG